MEEYAIRGKCDLKDFDELLRNRPWLIKFLALSMLLSAELKELRVFLEKKL